ncbi:hypothetical protein [Streptomyces luteireticuli]|uniref:hypothetical protein n=1 Tax=Streptomyces luteireticuli TaxID=173858 RepID=UPI003557A6A7
MSPHPPPESAVLDVHGVGNITVQMTTLEHGRARYVVRGPRVTGTFVVIPEVRLGGPVLPDRLQVQFGDGLTSVSWYTARDDEPRVFGVQMHGWTGDIAPDAPPTSYFLGRYACSFRDLSVAWSRMPDGARQRTEAVVLALVKHWSARSDRHQLVLAAARQRAREYAEHERHEAERLEAELAAVRAERAAIRRRINVITGLIRRRQPDIRKPDPDPVPLPFTDRNGQQLGVLAVREKEVNSRPGYVVLEAVGGRVRGTFTVGPDLYDTDVPIPRGTHIYYGRPKDDDSRFLPDCDDEPTVNGVALTGGWEHRSSTDDITPTSPDWLPARSARNGHTAPDATRRRASAALRALALWFDSRPDAEALRLAAAKDRASKTLRAARQELGKLRKQEARVSAALRRHRQREQQYRALLASVPTAHVSANAKAASPGPSGRCAPKALRHPGMTGGRRVAAVRRPLVRRPSTPASSTRSPGVGRRLKPSRTARISRSTPAGGRVSPAP